MSGQRRRKHWGWGYEDQQPTPEQARAAAPVLAERLGFAAPDEVEDPVPIERVELPAPRVAPPAQLAPLCDTGAHARASHALGKSYVDVVRGLRGHFEHPPDLVARPRDESDVERLLEWCGAQRIAAVPYGGGTSVVGGVTPDVGASFNGVVSIDLGAMDRLLEVDAVSRSASIEAGATGPRLEAQLAEHGLTLRHFPQSFEYSTLGGWIATRAAGHFATVWTHVEDLLESACAITPRGTWESRRLPGSGAGVSPDRMLVGSEGTLGVITRAWMRVQPRPIHRDSAGVAFADFATGAEAVRAISQSGLHPANCRLLDAGEAALTMAGDGSHALLVLGFESADHPVGEAMARALQICAEHGGSAGRSRSTGREAGAERGTGMREGGSGRGEDAGSASGAGGARKAGGAAPGAGGRDAVGSWRAAFLGAPYLRDLLVAVGVLSETFETAITWERFPALHEAVIATAQETIREVCGEGGRVHCRFTHVYPDGPAPYFTVLAPARRGAEIEQWGAIKQAVSDVLLAHGATITHHHAVGRDHRPWYDRQRPEPFAAALRGAKAALDPAGVLNPGVLLEAAS